MDDNLKDALKRIEYKMDKLIDCMDRLCEIVESLLKEKQEKKSTQNDSACICNLKPISDAYYGTASWVCPIHGVKY